MGERVNWTLTADTHFDHYLLFSIHVFIIYYSLMSELVRTTVLQYIRGHRHWRNRIFSDV